MKTVRTRRKEKRKKKKKKEKEKEKEKSNGRHGWNLFSARASSSNAITTPIRTKANAICIAWIA